MTVLRTYWSRYGGCSGSAFYQNPVASYQEPRMSLLLNGGGMSREMLSSTIGVRLLSVSIARRHRLPLVRISANFLCNYKVRASDALSY